MGDLHQKHVMFLISCYNLFICGTIVLTEVECKCLMDKVPLMSWWTLRGFTHIFASLLATHMAYFVGARLCQVFQDCASISLFCSGCVYIVMGVCGGSYTERAHIVADLDHQRSMEIEEVNRRWDLERRRAEL